ncbi:MAG: FliO/MopB family protein [Candidatus Aureabacteria bacterium]|nr:FliO/MopB family protein [Candidatus Auribacterota bacterium]
MMKKTIHLLICILLFNTLVVFSTSFLYAETTPGAETTAEEPAESFTLDEPEEPPLPAFDIKKSFFRMIISLVFVLVFIFGLAFVFKKLFSSATPFHKGKGLLRVIEKYPLGPKNYLMLVWAIDRMILVSFHNGSVEKISEFKSEAITREIESDVFEETLQREESLHPAEEVANA